MSIKWKKAALKTVEPSMDHSQASVKMAEERISGIDPDLLLEFGIAAEEAAGISSKRELVRAIASKIIQKQGGIVDEEILADIELMIETDPEMRDFLGSCFAE